MRLVGLTIGKKWRTHITEFIKLSIIQLRMKHEFFRLLSGMEKFIVNYWFSYKNMKDFLEFLSDIVFLLAWGSLFFLKKIEKEEITKEQGESLYVRASLLAWRPVSLSFLYF